MNVMTKKAIDWELVERAALQLGVSQFAIDKWRQRQSIPHKWRPQLVIHTGGVISWKQFELLDKQARKVA
jgi:hypothetical protein